MRDENQLHAAVVELVALDDDAEIKYSTVQNWYPGDRRRRRHLQLRHQARRLPAARSKISWTQVETGSAITWKYPSCILRGDDSVGEFYSVALTRPPAGRHRHQDDPHRQAQHPLDHRLQGHLGRARQNTYRGLGEDPPDADGARNHSQCDSLLIGDKCGAHTFPYVEVQNPDGPVEHEATTSRVSDDQIFYLNQRGIGTEDAVSLIVNGFARKCSSRWSSPSRRRSCSN